MKAVDKKKTAASVKEFARREEWYAADLEFTADEARAIERAAVRSGYSSGADYMRDLLDDLANGVMLGDGTVDYDLTFSMSQEDAEEVERRCRKAGYAGVEDGFKALLAGRLSRRELFGGLNVKQGDGCAAPLVGQNGSVFTAHFSRKQMDNIIESAINMRREDVRTFVMERIGGIVTEALRRKDR